jgi:predicted branched-subunit amino acid permease
VTKIEKNDVKSRFIKGVRAGIPIGMGYLSVSFTFGIMAMSLGFYKWQAILISMTCLTSAGQLAGINIMVMPGNYIEMLISQLTINVRYSFMSVSLAQKVSKKFSGIWRWLLGYVVTDEIYAVAIREKEITRAYFAGLAVLPYIGWTLGTLVGALLGDILPKSIMSALSIAIYGMFIAIIVPEMKKQKPVIFVVVLSAVFSCCFRYIKILQNFPMGLTISVCAVVAAVICAILFPVSDEDES